MSLRQNLVTFFMFTHPLLQIKRFSDEFFSSFKIFGVTKKNLCQYFNNHTKKYYYINLKKDKYLK